MNFRVHKVFVLTTTIVPFLALCAGAWLLLAGRVRGSDLVAFFTMSIIGGLGVSTGYHRLLAHRSFTASRPVRCFLAGAGAVAAQGPPIIWVAHHRRHHRHADKPGDPHSPYIDGDRELGRLEGLWRSHVGWLLADDLTSDPIRYCPDLARDRDMRFISNHFLAFVIAGMVAPGFIGLAVSGSMAAFWTGILWGGPIRLAVGNASTYAVNSLGHVVGKRRYPTPDESRNVSWLAIPSFGEAWHNNHHAFPRSAAHGMRWYEIDPSKYVIWTLEHLGLASDVVRIPSEVRERATREWAARGNGRHAPSAPPPPLASLARARSNEVTDVE